MARVMIFLLIFDGVPLGLVLDLLDLLGRGCAGLVLEVRDEELLGLLRTHPGDLLELLVLPVKNLVEMHRSFR